MYINKLLGYIFCLFVLACLKIHVVSIELSYESLSSKFYSVKEKFSIFTQWLAVWLDLILLGKDWITVERNFDPIWSLIESCW